MTNQVKSLGKTLLDNSGITKWLDGEINIKDIIPIPIYTDTTDWENFKLELDRFEKDPVQVDIYLKEHGLEQVNGLKDYILNNDIQQDSVNELITQQNYKNTANAAHGYTGVKKAIDEYNNSLKKNSDNTTIATAGTQNFVDILSTNNSKLANCMRKANGSSINMGTYAK